MTTYPMNEKLAYTPRRLDYRAKQAITLLRDTNGAYINNVQLRDLAGEGVKRAKQGTSYHNIYEPADIRRVREQLDPLLMERIVKKERFNGLPPMVCVHVSKGGTGKTAISTNLAASLAAQGYKVLLIDGDPQGSTTETFGIDPDHPEIKTLLSITYNNVAPEDAVIRLYENAHLDLIPADNLMTSIEHRLFLEPQRHQMMFQMVQSDTPMRRFLSQYEFVIIDTGPSSSTLNYNLMAASNLILGVVSLDGSSLKTLQALSADVRVITKQIQRPLPVMLLANMYHSVHKHCQDNLEYLRTYYQQGLFESVVPVNAAFSRQIRVWDRRESRPLIEEDPNCPSVVRLIELSQALANMLMGISSARQQGLDAETLQAQVEAQQAATV